MKWGSKLVIALIATLFLFGIGKAGVLSGPRNLVSGAVTPFQVGWYRFVQAASEKTITLSQIGSLSSDNLKLRDENDNLKTQLSLLSQVQKDNDFLKSQLGTLETKNFKLLSAQSLGFLPSIGTKELLLSVGSSSGVKVGQVVVSGSVVLGKIVSAESDHSSLELLTDPQSKVGVMTSRGAKGILIGQFQSSGKLTKVLQSESLNTGDIVLTTGDEEWPARLVIGEITKVTKRDNELFQEAEVRPLASYDKLQLVFVIMGPK